MSVVRSSIRESLKVLLSGFYDHDVYKTKDYSDSGKETEYALVYFSDGDVVDEGLLSVVDATLSIAFFKAGVDCDDQLDIYEQSLLAAISQDVTLGGLVRSCLYDGFSYGDGESAKHSLVVRFKLVY